MGILLENSNKRRGWANMVGWWETGNCLILTSIASAEEDVLTHNEYGTCGCRGPVAIERQSVESSSRALCGRIDFLTFDLLFVCRMTASVGVHGLNDGRAKDGRCVTNTTSAPVSIGKAKRRESETKDTMNGSGL